MDALSTEQNLQLTGRRVPDVTLAMRRDGELVHVAAADLFSDRTVVAFALPGAFTPTCSSAHLPRFADLAPVFREHGVDRIYCIAVNDPFVMEAWAAQSGVDGVEFLADGNGELTRALGMLVDQSAKGLGLRSRRYAFIAKDGRITHAFVEPDEEGDPYGVSDADSVLAALAPDARIPPDVALFTRAGCRFCLRAKRLLEERGIPYVEVVAALRTLRAVSGRQSTPQVFVDGTCIGGCDDLERWLQRQPRPGRAARDHVAPASVAEAGA
jgi:peroxiredoxin/glutaredoxin